MAVKLVFSLWVRPHLRLCLCWSDTDWNIFRNLLELSELHHLTSLDLCFLTYKTREQTFTIWRYIQFLEWPEPVWTNYKKSLENKVSNQDWLGMCVCIWIGPWVTEEQILSFNYLWLVLSSFWHFVFRICINFMFYHYFKIGFKTI